MILWSAMSEPTTPLQAVRDRIDAIDAELVRLVDERASMPAMVAAAKAAEAGGAAPGFGLRPAREAQVLRALLAKPRSDARPELIVRLWRELMGDSLARQGPFRLAVWGGRNQARAVELARQRFGAAPPLAMFDRPEDALAAARIEGVVAILSLEPGSAWWGKLLALPDLSVIACLPCLSAWGAPGALAIAAVAPEPSGSDQTFWVTDAPGSVGAIEDRLGEEGLAGDLFVEAGGLKLFSIAGYVQRDDERLALAPGSLKGVIGTAPLPFDL